MARRSFQAVLLILAALFANLSWPPAAMAGQALQQAERFALKRNYGKSAAILLAAAEAGDASAQYRIGMLYRLGLGIEQDDGAARRWLGRSAAQGNRKAERVLGRLKDRKAVRTTLALPPFIKGAVTRPSVNALARDKVGNSWLTRAAGRGLDKQVATMVGGPLDRRPPARFLAAAMLQASRSGSLETMRLLLEAGAAVNQTGDQGETPLMLAALSGHKDAVNYLLTHGADHARADKSGQDSLHYALRRCNGAGVLALLTTSQIAGPGPDGAWPLHRAASACDDPALPEELMKHQDVDSVDYAGRTALWLASATGRSRLAAELVSGKAQLSFADSEGIAPLQAAAHRGQSSIVDLLLERGADAAAVDRYGNNALMLAAFSGCVSCVSVLTKQAIFIDEPNLFGDTALIIAARYNNHGAVTALLAAQADPDVRNLRRETARSILSASGNAQWMDLVQ